MPNTIWLNPHFWSRYFRVVFCKQISDFYSLFTGRALSTFSSVNAEAEAATREEWDRLMNQPGDEDIDPATLAEQA